MERIFANNVKKELKHSIKSDVFVHVENDTLIVDIQPEGGYARRYTISNLANQLEMGLSSINVSRSIIAKYKNYILSKYFYKK